MLEGYEYTDAGAEDEAHAVGPGDEKGRAQGRAGSAAGGGEQPGIVEQEEKLPFQLPPGGEVADDLGDRETGAVGLKLRGRAEGRALPPGGERGVSMLGVA